MQDFLIETLGEWSYRILVGRGAPDWAKEIESASLMGVVDVVPAFDWIGLYFEPGTVNLEPILEILRRPVVSVTKVEQSHVVPVYYELGEDLQDCARQLSMDCETLIGHHLNSKFVCRAIGFCPGFPYLEGLDPLIVGTSRKSTPVLRVEPGTVAIMGSLCGIYPEVRPGGWWRLGRTPLKICDPTTNSFPISVGDRVTFERIDVKQFDRTRGQQL